MQRKREGEEEIRSAEGKVRNTWLTGWQVRALSCLSPCRESIAAQWLFNKLVREQKYSKAYLNGSHVQAECIVNRCSKGDFNLLRALLWYLWCIFTWWTSRALIITWWLERPVRHMIYLLHMHVLVLMCLCVFSNVCWYRKCISAVCSCFFYFINRHTVGATLSQFKPVAMLRQHFALRWQSWCLQWNRHYVVRVQQKDGGNPRQ